MEDKFNLKEKLKIEDASITQKGDMKMHIASMHEGKKPHKCVICNVSFEDHQVENSTFHIQGQLT